MANYRGTIHNDRWTVPRYGDPSNTLIDGFGGYDSLDFDRLAQSRFIITLDRNESVVHVDSVSGASSTFHLRLKNVEKLSFYGGRDIVDLTTYFGDTTAPNITSFSPVNGSDNVDVLTDITLNFDEAIVSSKGSIELLDSTGVLVETFLPSSFVINGARLSLSPTTRLLFDQSYKLSIANGAIADSAGNTFQADASYAFTTVVNTAPVTLPFQVTTLEDTTLNTALALATDAQSQSITYTLASNPDHGSIILNADGSFSYTPAAEYSGDDSFSYTASDGFLSSVVTYVTLIISPVVDNITGSAGADSLSGNADKDIFQGGAGDDILDGGAGLDYSVYSGVRANYLVESSNGQLQVTDNAGSDGSDTLKNMERLTFSDQGIAFDLDGNAGFAAKLLGLLLGPDGVSNKEYVGVALSMLDSGMSYDALTAAAFDVVLGSNPAHEEVVNLVYSNLIGSAPDTATLALYTSLLDDGSYTVGEFGVLAAEHQLNQGNVGIVGIAQTGLEYMLLV